MSIAYDAMVFARLVHKDQKRKYTNAPYSDHLAEVAGIVSTVDNSPTTIAIAWLHDCIEDCGVPESTLLQKFGVLVTEGVIALSDLEKGNRKERKALSRERLAKAPRCYQNIKVADLISNTSSIVEHDPKFAKVYLEEKKFLLDVLTKADERLVKIAREQCEVSP